MNWLKRAWSEVRRGENLDLYVTVGLAILLVLLTIVPLPVEGWVTPLTIAVLALLAVSMVGTRHRLDDMLMRTEPSHGVVLLDDFPEKLQADIGAAHDLWLVGVTMVQTTKKQLFEIERVLRQGGSVHVLVSEPDNPTLKVADARSYLSTGVESMSNDIRHTLAIFCQLRSKYRSRVDVRTIAYPLDHAIIATDINTSTGVLYISNYAFKIPGGSRPKFVVDSKYPAWYDFYRKELEYLFGAGQPWECPEGD